MADIDARLSLYQKLAKVEALEQLEPLAQEFIDRFGPLPVAVENLLYAVKIKLLATKAGIESIITEDGQIIVRRFKGVHFDQQKLEPVLRGGVRVGITQLRLNPRRLGGEWQKALEEVVNRIG